MLGRDPLPQWTAFAKAPNGKRVSQGSIAVECAPSLLSSVEQGLECRLEPTIEGIVTDRLCRDSRTRLQCFYGASAKAACALNAVAQQLRVHSSGELHQTIAAHNEQMLVRSIAEFRNRSTYALSSGPITCGLAE